MPSIAFGDYTLLFQYYMELYIEKTDNVNNELGDKIYLKHQKMESVRPNVPISLLKEFIRNFQPYGAFSGDSVSFFQIELPARCEDLEYVGKFNRLKKSPFPTNTFLGK